VTLLEVVILCAVDTKVVLHTIKLQ